MHPLGMGYLLVNKYVLSSKATSLYQNNTTPMKQLHLPSGCHYMHEDAPYYVVITHHDRTSMCTIGLPLNLLIEIKPGF